MNIKRFEDIIGWQLAERLTIEIYKLGFKTEYGVDLGLKVQIQRAGCQLCRI